MKRVGKVVDNVDPNHVGRVQVRIFPELVDVPTEDLPWADPTRKLDQHTIPKNDSFVFVEVSEDWTSFYYSRKTPHASALYPYERIKEKLSSAKNIGSHDYPQPSEAVLLNDGSTYFHNEDSGECGLIHSSGIHIILKENGSFSIVKNGAIDLEFDSVNKGIEIKEISGIKIPDLGTLILGGGKESVVLYDTLKEILDKLLDHNHIAPTGPTLPAQESSGTPLSIQKTKLPQMKSGIITSD